jgi:hypothetical protein
MSYGLVTRDASNRVTFDSRWYIANIVWTGKVDYNSVISLTGVNTRVVTQLQPWDTSFGNVFFLKNYLAPTVTIGYGGGYPTIYIGAVPTYPVLSNPSYSFYLSIISVGVPI